MVTETVAEPEVSQAVATPSNGAAVSDSEALTGVQEGVEGAEEQEGAEQEQEATLPKPLHEWTLEELDGKAKAEGLKPEEVSQRDELLRRRDQSSRDQEDLARRIVGERAQRAAVFKAALGTNTHALQRLIEAEFNEASPRLDVLNGTVASALQNISVGVEGFYQTEYKSWLAQKYFPSEEWSRPDFQARLSRWSLEETFEEAVKRHAEASSDVVPRSKYDADVKAAKKSGADAAKSALTASRKALPEGGVGTTSGLPSREQWAAATTQQRDGWRRQYGESVADRIFFPQGAA